jgi:23S rRNA (adenine-N6)-dimethyltransferase
VSAAQARRWGYHRLGRRAARRIVADADVTDGDLVLDLGAGTGALTGPLVEAGARVIAVELHPGRAVVLRRHFGESITVVEADVLRIPLPRRPFRVVANPPYECVQGLVHRLARSPQLQRADLLLPHWVTARWTDRWGASAAGRRVSRQAFTPCAPADAQVLVFGGDGHANWRSRRLPPRSGVPERNMLPFCTQDAVGGRSGRKVRD